MSLDSRINQQITGSRQQAGFGPSVVPSHNHDGINSPKIKQLFYSGHVNSGGTTKYLPYNWTCQKFGAGIYQINHYLGTINLAIAITCVDFAQLGYRTSEIIAQTTTSISLALQNKGLNADCEFVFIVLTQN